MLFNSYEFVFLFLPVALCGYFWFGCRKQGQWANGWLIFMSLFFYSWWEIKYLPLLLVSIIVNYIVSGAIITYRKVPLGVFTGKIFFIFGIIFNVSLLGYYKYTDFFLENLNLIMGTHHELLHIVLPLGVSFFTITQMVYLVDCYEGVAKNHDFSKYCLFVSFFPHLLAGPILYHKAMMKQFADTSLRRVNWDNMAQGLVLFIIGLAKKVLVADTLSKTVAAGFNAPEQLTLIDGWVTAMAYSMQLYFDFSGYSDMAVGIARMMNINIPINFNSPYKAKNIIDFWSRWHISLTNTIMNYLYTPLFMSFKKMSFIQAMFATFIAMFIAGIWHGAGWTFIVFGTMHAIGLVICHTWKHYKMKMSSVFAHAITLFWVLVAFVFFRARSVFDAMQVLSGMAGQHGMSIRLANTDVEILLVICAAITALLPNSNQLVEKLQLTTRWAVLLGLFFVYVLLYMVGPTEFLYFHF
jgi:alginate O-acetyltransferase complex protein AlgI